MPRNIREVLDHADDLSRRFENYEPDPNDERDPKVYASLRAAVLSETRFAAGHRTVVAAARHSARGVAAPHLAALECSGLGRREGDREACRAEAPACDVVRRAGGEAGGVRPARRILRARLRLVAAARIDARLARGTFGAVGEAAALRDEGRRRRVRGDRVVADTGDLATSARSDHERNGRNRQASPEGQSIHQVPTIPRAAYAGATSSSDGKYVR